MCAGMEARAACRAWLSSRPQVLAACALCAAKSRACEAEGGGNGQASGQCARGRRGGGGNQACDVCAAQRELFAWQFPPRRPSRLAPGAATGGGERGAAQDSEEGKARERDAGGEGAGGRSAAGDECGRRRVLVHQFDGAGWNLARQLLFVAQVWRCLSIPAPSKLAHLDTAPTLARVWLIWHDEWSFGSRPDVPGLALLAGSLPDLPRLSRWLSFPLGLHW